MQAGSTSSGDVFALDFDGVICNSVGESSRSGFRALKSIWPEVAASLGDAGEGAEEAPQWLLDKMRDLRPVVETGYENILLTRFLIEERVKDKGGSASNLLDTWGAAARDELIKRYGVSKEKLVEIFGEARDDWIKNDFGGWLGANSYYDGVNEAVSACKGEVYVVTTKQQRFASALLEHAGLKIPVERIYGLGSGPKVDVLSELKAKHSGQTIHFFEDRVETLEAVCADSRLQDNVRLYLCSWGFNTEEHRARGEANARIQLIGTDEIGGILAGA
ncbi:unnamed protein product [Sphacelaria rigidula]